MYSIFTEPTYIYYIAENIHSPAAHTANYLMIPLLQSFRFSMARATTYSDVSASSEMAMMCVCMMLLLPAVYNIRLLTSPFSTSAENGSPHQPVLYHLWFTLRLMVQADLVYSPTQLFHPCGHLRSRSNRVRGMSIHWMLHPSKRVGNHLLVRLRPVRDLFWAHLLDTAHQPGVDLFHAILSKVISTENFRTAPERGVHGAYYLGYGGYPA